MRLNSPLLRTLTLLAVGAFIMTGVKDCAFPAVANLLDTDPDQYEFFVLRKGYAENINFTDSGVGGNLVGTLILNHTAQPEVSGGLHLGTGPCDHLDDQTRDKGWMVVHSVGHGATLNVPPGYCWSASLFAEADQAVVWFVPDWRWWHRRYRFRTTSRQVQMPQPLLVPTPPEQTRPESDRDNETGGL